MSGHSCRSAYGELVIRGFIDPGEPSFLSTEGRSLLAYPNANLPLGTARKSQGFFRNPFCW